MACKTGIMSPVQYSYCLHHSNDSYHWMLLNAHPMN